MHHSGCTNIYLYKNFIFILGEARVLPEFSQILLKNEMYNKIKLPKMQLVRGEHLYSTNFRHRSALRTKFSRKHL